VSESKKSKRGSSLLELSLPNALATAAVETIGPRRFGRLSQETRGAIMSTINDCAENLGRLVAGDQGTKRVVRRKRSDEQPGGEGSEA
jgi:hypothetical protein